MATVNEYKTIWFKIDGRQSYSIPIDIKKNGRYLTEPVDVIVRGYLKFEDETPEEEVQTSTSLLDRTTVYPVLFTTDTVRVSSGRLLVTLLSRSEDIFETTSSLEQRASNSSVDDDDIVSVGGIPEDEQINNTGKEPVEIKIETGETRDPYKISLGVIVVPLEAGGPSAETVDRGTKPKVEVANGPLAFLFKKEKKRVASNFILSCFNNLDWIPVVNALLGDNNGTRDEIITFLNNLENSTAFGASTLYDAIVSGARILSDTDLASLRKLLYVFVDNETTASVASIDNAIEEVNDIDGARNVPILVGNMSIVQPETLSVKANTTDTRSINQLSVSTGGQSLTINSEDYLNDVVGIFYSETVGSLGYGTYEFIADLEEESLINNITASFDVPADTANATWNIETSTDGYTYSIVDADYDHNENVVFQNLYARYIKIKIILITGFSSEEDEYGTIPESPALTSVTIVYNKSKVAYLYLNNHSSDIVPYQITLAVDANEVNDDQIRVGIAKSNSHNWTDYHLDSQPSVNQNGKVVIPIRFSQDINTFQNEPLKKIDNFVLKAEYGNWDPYARVFLYDNTDSLIASNQYKVLPREGLIIR